MRHPLEAKRVLVELQEDQFADHLLDCEQRVEHDEPFDERLDKVLVYIEDSIIDFDPQFEVAEVFD